jgi:DNA-binding HxlR family transcriptional regulator
MMTGEDLTRIPGLASAAVELLRGKWTIQILWAMRDQPVRLSQLARTIPGASKKVITKQLRELELSGVIVRRDLSAQVLHVEYELKSSAKDSSLAILMYLAEWAMRFDDLRSEVEQNSKEE